MLAVWRWELQVQLSITLWNVGFAQASGSIVFTGLASVAAYGEARYVLTPSTASFAINLPANGNATFSPTFSIPGLQATSPLYYFLSWCVVLAVMAAGAAVHPLGVKGK